MINTTALRPTMSVIKNDEIVVPTTSMESKKEHRSARLYVVSRKNYVTKRYSFDDNGGGYRGL